MTDHGHMQWLSRPAHPDSLPRWPHAAKSRTRPPRVHLLAGLKWAGKTTYARRLEADLPAVRFTLDEWMLRLHELRYDDPTYPELAESCKSLIWDTAQQVLRARVDVVLDWNQWSRKRRREWATRATQARFEPVLHYIRVPLVQRSLTPPSGTRMAGFTRMSSTSWQLLRQHTISRSRRA
jgi:hypothetical protein